VGRRQDLGADEDKPAEQLGEAVLVRVRVRVRVRGLRLG